MEAELIPYPHTRSSFEVRRPMWSWLAESFDVIIEDLRSEVLEDCSIRIEELHREILNREFHREWGAASDIRRFYEGWVRENYAHFFSNARYSQVENDHSHLISNDDVPAGQPAPVHGTSSTIMETRVNDCSHIPISFEMRQAIRASVIAIFDIRWEDLRSLFDEDQETRVERIRSAILNNEPHHHWNSVTEMYRALEECLRDGFLQALLGDRMAANESDSPSAAHRGAFAIEAMMRNVSTPQSIGNALGEDIAGNSTERPSADLRDEDAGMYLSSNVGSFEDGNDVTPAAPIDAIEHHPDSYSSSGDEVHRRIAGDEERERVLHRGHSIANGPEVQIPEDRNRRLSNELSLLMEIVRLGWHQLASDTSVSQGRNDSSAPSMISRVDSNSSSASLNGPEGDSGTPSLGEGGGEAGGRGGRGLGSYPQDSQHSERWIHHFAISHPIVRASVPVRPPSPVPPPRPTQHRTFRPRRRRLPQTPPDAAVRPSWRMSNVDTRVRRRNENSRVVGATGQGQFDTLQMPFGRECVSLPLFVEC